MGNLRWELGVHVITRFIIVINQIERFGHLIIFVVSSKYHYRRVVTQPLYSLFCLNLDTRVEFII